MGGDRRGGAAYKCVLIAVFAAIMIMYVVTAFTGYYLYGDAVHPLIIKSLPSHGYLYVQIALNIGLGLHCFIVHSIVTHALAEELERRLIPPPAVVGGADDDDGPQPTRHHPSSISSIVKMEHLTSPGGPPRVALRVSLIAWTFAVAYWVPNFGSLCDVAGCFCVFTVFTFPCVITLAAKGPRVLGCVRTAWIVTIAAATLLGWYFGFKNAMKEVRDSFGS